MAISGGYRVTGEGPGDDGYDEEGYDESQRAEILEATGGGPTDGAILTDIEPDIAADDEDDLKMRSDEVGEEDMDADQDEDDRDEDSLQDDFDDDGLEDDDDLDDADDVALKP